MSVRVIPQQEYLLFSYQYEKELAGGQAYNTYQCQLIVKIDCSDPQSPYEPLVPFEDYTPEMHNQLLEQLVSDLESYHQIQYPADTIKFLVFEQTLTSEEVKELQTKDEDDGAEELLMVKARFRYQPHWRIKSKWSSIYEI